MAKHHMKKTQVLALVVALATCIALPAAAATATGLRVSADAHAHVAAGESAFRIGNDSAGTLDGLRVVSDRSHDADCATRTEGGRPFTDVLRAGESVRCVVRPTTQIRLRNASVIVTAHAAGDDVVTRTFSLAQPTATPAQASVVLVAGGVLGDANANDQLDAGETIDYDITVLNVGTLALSALAVGDNDGAVTCPQTALAPGAWMTCMRSHVISAGEAAVSQVLNQIDVSGTDAAAGTVLAGDLVLTQDFAGDAGIRVFKSPLLQDDVDASGYASAGDLVHYTFVVKNDNADPLTAVNLVEPDGTRIDTLISCSSTTLGGASFGALGAAALAPGDVVLCGADYTIRATDASSGSADNLVEVSAQPTFGGPVGGSGASAIVIPLPADVSVAKALSAESGTQPGVAEPGETLTYTITLDNAGGADALDVDVVDPLDPNVSFVSASNGGTLIGSTVAWSGLDVPAGGSLALSVTVTVAAPIPPGVTQVANLVHLTGTTPPLCAIGSTRPDCVVIPTPGAVIIDKALIGESGSTAGVAEAGETLTYTITLGNPGGSDVTGFGVSDPLDPNVTFVSASGGGAFAGGIVTWSNLTVPAGGSVVLTVVVAVVDPLAPGVTQVANLAYPTGSTPPDCNVVPVPAACVVTPAATPRLQVTKTVDAPIVRPGGTATYTITVSNVGIVPATNVVVADPLPPGIDDFDWTCAATGGAACSNAQGTGVLNESIAVLPVGGVLTYTLAATVAANANGSILNSVTVTPGSNTVCMPGATPGPCEASAPVDVVVGPTGTPVAAPALGPFALLLLAFALVAFARRGFAARMR
jgi:uncharacterized repeat protein (TIGR01451 family)